jgi:hypothetical protein
MPGWLSQIVGVLGWPAAAARRRVARTSLFTSVAFAIVTGAAIAVIVSFAIGIALHARFGGGSPPPLDVLKTALTVVAGVGGAVALVVAYRRQRDLEQGRFVERFGAAAAQLGHADVAVRIAGVYAMAGVADESRDFARRQQCIDVLCGYLRLPYDAENGASHLAKLIVKIPPSADGQEQVEKHYEYRQQDGEVRQTIVRTIAERVRAAAVNSWSHYNFDFRSAVLEGVNFNDAQFLARANFADASFLLETTFEGVRFDRCSFSGAKFMGDTSFTRSAFFCAANFESTIFAASARFDRVKFHDEAKFEEAEFNGMFTTFSDTTFGKSGAFNFAKFSGRETWFGGGTRFRGFAVFAGAEFGAARFGDMAVNVGNLEFARGPTIFEGRAFFQGAIFAKEVDFNKCVFAGEVEFNNSMVVSRKQTKGGPKFLNGAHFDSASFGGGGSFVGADFGLEEVSFRNPVAWADSLIFDWTDDVSRKPANVKPDTWPPVARAR